MDVEQQTLKIFEERKRDHIRLSLKPENEALGESGLKQISLTHEALPEIDFGNIDISLEIFGQKLNSPVFVSSMTAGHPQGININLTLARVCQKRGWAMGVGSQRKELFDPNAANEWRQLRRELGDLVLMGNIGLSQLIQVGSEPIRNMAENLDAIAMIVHTNPLQECLQPEGTPNFRGGMKALADLCSELSIPVVLKETGCGFSANTLEKLKNIGLGAVDISGYGGTHWGRIEGKRADLNSIGSEVAGDFAEWGIPTVECLLAANQLKLDYPVWASGGVRSGLDVAKLLAMGAQFVGMAKPLLQAALRGEEVLDAKFQTVEYGLKTAMFCTGCVNIDELQRKEVWQWQKMK